MMEANELVMTCITALQSGDMGMAASLLADDFVLRGWVKQQLDKGQFLALQSNLLVAMPDFSYNLSDVHMEGQSVQALIQISGTNLGNFDLTMLDIAPIQATGLAVELPQVPVTFLTENDTIKEMATPTVAGGGLSGLLQQIGGELPVAPRLEEQFE
jgi:hypothetical protein